MKIEKYEKIKDSQYRLYLDNGEIIDTYDDIILKHELLIKKEITPSIYNKITYDNKIQELCNICIKYISYRIRSTKEITDYLKRKNTSLIIYRLRCIISAADCSIKCHYHCNGAIDTLCTFGFIHLDVSCRVLPHKYVIHVPPKNRMTAMSDFLLKYQLHQLFRRRTH